MSLRPRGTLSEDLLQPITREELAELPIGRYQGDVHLVRTAGDLERALDDFHREECVGFDTETRPSFRKGESHAPALVQVATARAVYLFRLREASDFHVPRELLAKPDTLKVGVALADDIRALKEVHIFEERSMLDLGSVAKRHGLRQTGVRSLAGIFLKVRIPKGTKTSNWAAPRLTAAQIRYAATDAWICRELFLRFRGLGMIPDADPPPRVSHPASRSRKRR